jgi:hypothetical protein
MGLKVRSFPLWDICLPALPVGNQNVNPLHRRTSTLTLYLVISQIARPKLAALDSTNVQYTHSLRAAPFIRALYHGKQDPGSEKNGTVGPPIPTQCFACRQSNFASETHLFPPFSIAHPQKMRLGCGKVDIIAIN